MAEIDDLSTTDANNNGSAANAGFPENMNYSDVNNAARALEGMIARWHGDNNGTLDSTGSSNTYALSPNRTIGAYARGQEFEFEANHTNTGAATLNVSSLGAKNIVKTDGAALGANDIVSGGVYKVIYDGTNFQLVGVPASKLTLSATTAVDLSDGDNVLNVGATTGQHLAFDGNDIQSKSDATTAATLQLNRLGGGVALGGQSAAGTVTIYNGSSTYNLQGNNQGVRIQRNTGTTSLLYLQDESSTVEAHMISRAAANVQIKAYLAGRGVELIGRNAGDSADNTLFKADPDSNSELYNAGVMAARTHDRGFAIRPSDNADDNYVSLLYEDSSGTDLANIGFLNEDIFTIRNSINSGAVHIEAANSAGTNTNILQGHPDQNTSIYAAGNLAFQVQADGGDFYATEGVGSSCLVGLQDGDSERGYIRKRGDNGSLEVTNAEHGGHVLLRAENTSGTLTTLFTGDPDLGVSFNGKTPAAPPNYTVSNANTDRTYDANATSINELADVLGTLIDDLINIGLLQ